MGQTASKSGNPHLRYSIFMYVSETLVVAKGQKRSSLIDEELVYNAPQHDGRDTCRGAGDFWRAFTE